MPVILVIDDHPAICFAAKAVLEQEQGFSVITSHGGQILPLLRHHEPQLVILDIALDNEDGLLLLPRIRQHHPECKVLIHSGLATQLYAGRALRAGANGFISKQNALSHLLPACYMILNGYAVFPGQAFALAQNDTPSSPHQLLTRLSDRELVVLRLLQEGKSNKTIAEQLALSHKTIATYKARILEKSAAGSFEQLLGWLQEEPQTK